MRSSQTRAPFCFSVMFIGYAEILDICSTVLIVQVSGCQTLEKSLLIQEMGATNPEKVKMVVKNMETFMPKVMFMITTMTISRNSMEIFSNHKRCCRVSS